MQPYRPSAKSLLKGLQDMVHLDTTTVAAAAASGRPLRSPEGHVLKVTELPPRLTFNTPSSTNKARPVLYVLPTYYAL